MITPEQFDAVLEKIDKYIEEHPEIIEDAVKKFAENFADVKDITLGDKIEFTIADNPKCYGCIYENTCESKWLGRCRAYRSVIGVKHND